VIDSAEADFAHLKVLVVHPRDRDGETLLRQLQRLGCSVTHRWPPDGPLDGADVLICLVQEGCRAMLEPPPTAAVIGIADVSAGSSLRRLGQFNLHAAVAKPIDPRTLLTALVVSRNNFRYERRLLTKISKLEETLRSARKVERAKAILMERRNMEEPEAYAFLRSQAMRKRVPVGVIAAAVIDSSEVLSDDTG
jgi:AmiR/NasT family two-component response regulator